MYAHPSLRSRDVQLQLAGTDAIVVVADHELRVERASGEVAVLPVHPSTVLDIATFPDQVWIARREAGAVGLLRFSLDGKLLDAPFTLSSGAGRLIASSMTPLAVWQGAPSKLLSLEANGIRSTVLEPSDDVVLPLAPTRVVGVRGHFASLRVATAERWSARVLPEGTRAIGGTALFDGSSVVILAAHSGTSEQSLIVVATRDGAVQRRFTVRDARVVQIAARRGHAAVLLRDNVLTLLDLRFGRAIGEYVHDADIEAIAIDATGHVAVILDRDENGARVARWLSVARALAEPRARPRDADASEDVEPASAVTVEASNAAPAEPTSAALPDVSPPEPPVLEFVDPPALRPRARTPRTPPALALQLLERERALVAALCQRAIAEAWDSGRLVWAHASEHPYETEVLGILGCKRGRAGARASEAEGAVTAAREALAAFQRSAAAALNPIDEIVQEFELSPLARSILLIVAAPTIWGEIARLYGVLANDSQRAVVDELLVRQVFGNSFTAHDIARELDPERPLLRHGIVRVGSGTMRPFLPLQVDALVVRRLRGDAASHPDAYLTIVEPTRALHELFLAPEVTAALTEALAEMRPDPVRLVIRGRDGSGRRTLLAALAASANRRLAIVDVRPMIRDGKLHGGTLRESLLRATLGGCLPSIDGLDLLAHDDRPQREIVREVIRAHPGPIAVRLGADATPLTDPGHFIIDLLALSESRRADVWRQTLAVHHLAVSNVEEIAARWRIGPGIVQRVVSAVARQPSAAGGASATRIDQAVRQHLETRLGEIATRVTRLASWSEVVLPPDVLDSLLELVARVRYRRTVYEQWGFDRVMTTSRGLTALFQGGPGTGKTMVAGAVARELGLDVYRVDLSKIVSKWIGETERNLAQVFDAAEEGHSIILFDEADSLFAKRTEVKSSVDRYANLEVNYLLQRLDSFGGIAILTTNFGGGIDAAFKRRLSFRLSFPFPDEEMREQLWQVHLPSELPRAGAIDLGELARKYKMSGGYIRNATLRAAFLAAADQSPLRQEHLERAVKLEYREIGKLADTGSLE
jgi:hypothetical protein